MINDLRLSTKLGCNRWKYVDDITLSDTLLRGQSSCLQSDLDRIHQCQWAVDNNMRLNPSKCKIMRMCFFREQPVLPVFTIDGKPFDSVFYHKVLGLTLRSDLRWNAHVDSIVPKAAKRLYILRILRCANVTTTDLVTVYVTLIRPLLEYGCIVWDESLLFSNCARSLEYSSLSTLAGLSYHICGKLEVALKASPSSQHQHCTDEAQMCACLTRFGVL
ncbi:hypothetical protein P5673_029993 [Acropora cervicornis]|uniref:Alkylated DNA repair protein AlkB homologue 8 N-terminal domain-containing protein n=1 Tax=Acropora cervicornis TaxID=6130 RepID=A0AAD9PUQ7_ACRCE|nr:hypothetical protein P5673_029993 [Acropora cervicornis]